MTDSKQATAQFITDLKSRVPKVKHYVKYEANKVGQVIQADLMFIVRNKAILVCIDTYTRYIGAYFVDHKKSDTVYESLTDFMFELGMYHAPDSHVGYILRDEFDNHKILTDGGTEFKGIPKENHIVSKSAWGAMLAERLVYSIRKAYTDLELESKYDFNKRKAKAYNTPDEDLDKIVKMLNNQPRATLNGYTAKQVLKNEIRIIEGRPNATKLDGIHAVSDKDLPVYDTDINNYYLVANLDKVHKKITFQKRSDTLNWSPEVYNISGYFDQHGVRKYSVRNVKTGKEHPNTFYYEQLKPINDKLYLPFLLK